MRFSLVSLDQVWQEKKANFDRCLLLMSQAKSYGCELVIFPEMTLTGYSLNMADIAEYEDKSLTINWFNDAASAIGLTIVFGACLCNSVTGKPRNSFCMARPNHSFSITYSKVHPFSFAGEDKVLEAGNHLGMDRIGKLKIGATICYDLRFPELFSAMASDCDAIITIANWPERRVNHWRNLLIARAIENQCYMFGVNRIGVDGNGFQYQKSSLVVTPDGEVLKPTIPGYELDIYDIDPADVMNYRASFPTLRDKRYRLYSDLLKRD
jgi:predicted amidohydrolase